MVHTKQKEKLMKILNCSAEEAIEIINSDKQIDRGEKLFDLDPELEAGAKKVRQADRKPTTAKREKKADADKGFLLNLLFSAVLPYCDTYEVSNAERELVFTYKGKKYKVVLSAPRS